MKKTEEIIIDDTRYSRTQYSATKASLLLAKLMKLLGKPLGMLTAAGGMEADLQPDLVGKAIAALTELLEPEEFVKMVKEILEGTVIFTDEGNRPIIFDTDFAGRMGHLLKLLKSILGFQYNDFLGGLAGATAKLSAGKKTCGSGEGLVAPNVPWAVWRVILEHVATLEEIETHWSINDLADANDVLDYRDAVRASEIRRIKQARGSS